MKKYIIALVVLVFLIVAACTLPGQLLLPHANISGQDDFLLVAPPGSSPTPTPFQPIPPTQMYQPGAVTTEFPGIFPATPVPDEHTTEEPGNPWGEYPGPSVWPDIDIPTPAGILTHPDGQVNILLLGSDQRPNDGGFRTDTIQLLTINPQEGTVKLTAFPRDLYVYIPGYTMQRINTSMGWGGFEALATTMEYNFGVRPDYYVLINFWSFVDVIDSLGGVTVNVEQYHCDQRDGYESYCVYQGPTWMDGETALWYVRSRYTTSDLDRGRRQQEVLEAMFDQLINLNGLQRIPELYEIYKQNVTTNIDFSLLSNLLPIAINLSGSGSITGNSIGEGEVYSWTTPSGAMVLVPIREQVMEVMRQVISEP